MRIVTTIYDNIIDTKSIVYALASCSPILADGKYNHSIKIPDHDPPHTLQHRHIRPSTARLT